MELAINLTIVGMVVVFSVLVLLSAIISLFSKIASAGKTGGKDKMNTKDNDMPAPQAHKDVVEESTAYIEQKDDSELVAVLTAAVIAAMGGSSESNIHVKSYRRIPQISPVWNSVSRKEQIAAKL
ncbi:OadG family protein [Pseudoclostridium thermosuccinogenes]|jgi:sodium pump decarboxylase gamma subunit|uniref:OadG family protein n=1 Tax=Clostridium thermosuccinogenes TaxID=84032 RepID=UPI000CCC4C82|nr:OadG family protein [Pseudoclostridium thermosuccinogenes]PNT92619.1 hypothetical protein CDQ83_03380 [Pseudoclostridium thermosuccinogenes]